MATLAESFLADLEELDDEGEFEAEEAGAAGAVPSGIGLADALNYDDLDSVAPLVHSERYRSILQVRLVALAAKPRLARPGTSAKPAGREGMLFLLCILRFPGFHESVSVRFVGAGAHRDPNGHIFLFRSERAYAAFFCLPRSQRLPPLLSPLLIFSDTNPLTFEMELPCATPTRPSSQARSTDDSTPTRQRGPKALVRAQNPILCVRFSMPAIIEPCRLTFPVSGRRESSGRHAQSRLTAR